MFQNRTKINQYLLKITQK